ncbi:MAG: ShlB/FhaC/HecB family hemolysin secretion/activation protein [Luteolibacter sp.]
MRFFLPIFFLQSVSGQLLPGIDPSIPEPEKRAPIPSVETLGGMEGEGAVIMGRLEKVTLVSWVSTGVKNMANGLDASEGLILPSPDKLSETLAKWMGEALTEGDLATMADAILIHYDAAGYPVVMIDVPEQDLSAGNLMFVVEMGVIGNVGVTNPSYSSPAAIRKGLWLRGGEVIRRKDLNAQMDWYGRSVFRKPRLLVSPGQVPPSADVLIGLTERKPWTGMVGYENSGQEAIGRDHFLLGGAFMTKGEHVVAWQTVIGAPVSSLQAHAVTWEIPFHSLHQALQLSGSYALVETSSSLVGLPIENEGTSWAVSAMHRIPLPGMGDWKHSMRAGLELKSTDQFVLFGGSGLSPGEVRFLNARVGYSLEREWKKGGFVVDASLSGAPGNLISENDDADFKSYDAEADSSYVIGRLSSEGWWTPGGDWKVALRAEGQVADSRLLPAEQFAAGGYQSVRGVDEREFFADMGWQSSFEIYSPAISVGSGSGLRFLVFYDQAWLRNRGESSDSLSGAGIGIRARLTEYLDLRVDHGWRLDDEGSRTHVGLKTTF